jgi:RimJ/RimL family protein N-acetyltransferase
LDKPPAIHIPEQFESERLIIRAPRVRDAAELIAAIEESLAELRPWMPWAKSVPTMEQSKTNLRRARRQYLAGKDFRLNVFLRGTDTFIAGMGIHRVDWSVPKVEIGYWIRTPYSGQGYVTEAVNAITEFAVKHFGAKRVEIRMDNRNVRSWRVAERCGFELEGILRSDRRCVDGTLEDTRVYARVMQEGS